MSTSKFPTRGIQLPIIFHGEAPGERYPTRCLLAPLLPRCEFQHAMACAGLLTRGNVALCGKRHLLHLHPPSQPQPPRLPAAVVRWQRLSSLADLGTPAVTAQQVADQVAVLNRDYAGTGLQFLPPAVKFYDNQTWTGDCWNSLGDILKSVNKQPHRVVTIVVCDLAGSAGILGCAARRGGPAPLGPRAAPVHHL